MRGRWPTIGLLLVACGSPPGGSGSTAGGSSTSTGGGDSNGASTSTGASTSAGTSTSDEPTPTVELCDLLEPVMGRKRRCVVLHRGGTGKVHGVDLDGDGTDEIFTGNASVGESSFEGAALWRWTGTEVVGGDLGFGRMTWVLRCWVRFDFDRDGTNDLHCLGQGGDVPGVLRIVDGDLAMSLPQLDFEEPKEIRPSGAASVVDPDEDGVYERLITIAWPPEIGGFGMFREEDGVLVPHGPRFALGGCAIPDGVAYADFDEDGHEDVVIRDNPIGCDGYPTMYDPTWHRAHVLRARPEMGDMDLVASLPIGAMQTWDFGQIYAEDVTGDGHADVSSTLEPPYLVSFIEGHGDGTFGEAQVFSAADVGLADETRARFLAQLDDDPWLEVLVDSGKPGERQTVLVLDDVQHGLAILEEIEIPSAQVKGAGDFDGDGIGDLAVSGHLGDRSENVLLLSRE